MDVQIFFDFVLLYETYFDYLILYLQSFKARYTLDDIISHIYSRKKIVALR